MMPGMNGLELEESLLARRPSLRVLFISGYAEDVLVSDVGLVPGAAFLGKPFKPKALLSIVHEVLDGPPAIGSSRDGSTS
jgi:two-component system, cell cycle sensor histidine kinase and response regulator CckA